MMNPAQNALNVLTGSPQTTPQDPKVHRVPWGKKAFPKDGSGVTMKVAPGERIQFTPIDDSPHNVTEALLEHDSKMKCGYRWIRNPKPHLDCNYKTQRKFNEILDINEEGTYHLVCPNNHETMRLTVMASENAAINQVFEQAKKAQTPAVAAPQGLLQNNPLASLFGARPVVNAPLATVAAVQTARNPPTFNIFSPYFVLGPLGAVTNTQPRPRNPNVNEFVQNLQNDVQRVQQLPEEVPLVAAPQRPQVQIPVAAPQRPQVRVNRSPVAENISSILNGI